MKPPTGNSPEPFLRKPSEIWDFLVENELDTKNYDRDLVVELFRRLGIPQPCDNFKKELRPRKVSSEQFVVALLKTIQPYALMMTDLCAFFYFAWG